MTELSEVLEYSQRLSIDPRLSQEAHTSPALLLPQHEKRVELLCNCSLVAMTLSSRLKMPSISRD